MFFLFVCVECFAVSKGFPAVAAKVACVRVFDEVPVFSFASNIHKYINMPCVC